MAGLFEESDRSRFDLYAYSYGPDDGSATRERIRAAFGESWRDVGSVSDADAAAIIRNDGIDLLIDRKGHTRGGRLGILASRPAPVQLHYMSFPGTLGYDAVDGIIADGVVDPRGQRRRPTTSASGGCRAAISSTTDAARCPRPPRASDAGLPEDALVFACLNQSYKLSLPGFRDLDGRDGARAERRAVAARTGCAGEGESAALRRAGRRRSGATSLRAACAAGGAYRPAALRRSCARHASIRFAHDGVRRALGGRSDVDLSGSDIRESCRCEPAAHGRVAAAHRGLARRLSRAPARARHDARQHCASIAIFSSARAPKIRCSTPAVLRATGKPSSSAPTPARSPRADCAAAPCSRSAIARLRSMSSIL